jgi:hypothetical protein
MLRTLIALLALLSLTAAASSDTAPNPADRPSRHSFHDTARQYTIAATSRRSELPAFDARRPRLMQGLYGRQGLRQYLHLAG